eukprot:7003731-Ditylum_brightwellii.AAC.1
MVSSFVIAMDDYFTIPWVLSSLHDKDIRVVGRARYRGQNCPPKELKYVNKDDALFNNFY